MSAPRFETFGCRLNAYETEAMKELTQGLTNVTVVNTCAVTAEAVRQAKQRIRRISRENPGQRIVVTGCAAQTEPATFSTMEEVSHVVGNIEKMQPETWNAFGLGQSEPVQVNDIMSAKDTAGHLIDGFGTRARAYVQVQNGCDHRCTFCVIPFGRGNSRSVPAGVVVEQIKRLVQNGYNEVVLTGVDMTSWGADLPGAPRLGNLVRRVLKMVPDLSRLRLSSIDQVEVDPDLMEAIATEPRFMPHLHLSLQSGDDMILKRMKRRHNRDDAIRFCEETRSHRKDVVFGADIIAGFPTETDAMFENTKRLVEECGLTWLHVFPYSPRQGTPAARMPQVERSVIKRRAASLRTAGAARVEQYLSAQIGVHHDVLMESQHVGRTPQFALVRLLSPSTTGQIVHAKVTDMAGTDLIADPCFGPAV